MLHHDDPFVMAIAMDVKNQRDAARSSVAAPSAAQPTVVNQLIARMAQLPPMQGGQGQQMPTQPLAQPPQPQVAPQATQTAADGGLMHGIARLPARNLTRMADGGITMTPGMLDFAQRSEPVVRMADGGVPGYKDKGLATSDDSDEQGSPFTRWMQELTQGIGQQTEEAKLRARLQSQYGPASAPIGLFMSQTGAQRQRAKDIMAQLPTMSAPEMQQLLATGLTPDEFSAQRETARLLNVAAAPATPTSTAAPATAPTAATPTAATPTAATPTAAPAAATGAPKTKPSATPGAAPAAAATGIQQLVGPPAPDRIDRLLASYKPATVQELSEKAQIIAEPWNKEIETSNKPFKEQFAEERKRLSESGEQNKWQAIMEAGLSMMASRSPYALQAFGEGGLRGLQMYQAAQKQDDAARKALMHSEMMMAQSERAERSGNRRDAVQLATVAENERKAALQLGLQAEQIRNTNEYQQGLLSVQQGLLKVQQGKLSILQSGAAQDAKLRSEFTKVQGQVMRDLSKEMEYQTADENKKMQMRNARIREAMLANPLLASYASGVGFMPSATGTVRADLTKDKDED